MNQINIIANPMGSIQERRLVLAKVYKLLIQLAERATEKSAVPSTAAINQGQIDEPILVAEDSVSK